MGKFGVILLLATITVAGRVVVSLWYHALIFKGYGDGQRDAATLDLLLMAVSVAAVAYVLRRALWYRILLVSSVYLVGTYVGGLLAILVVLASFGIAP
jgi:hypothetical protein